MKRKRSDKGKQPLVDHPYEDGKILRFDSSDQLQEFKEFLNVKLQTPRYIDVSWVREKGYDEAYSGLRRSHWLDLFGHRSSSFQPLLVRAFYSNMTRDEDGDLHTSVNGTNFIINEENIHILTSLPNPDDAEFPEINLEAFYHEMGAKTKGAYGNRTISGMKPEYRFLHYVIVDIIKPRKSSRTTITQEDAKMIYYLVNHSNVNWCNMVKNHLWDCREKKTILPYIPLVLAFLKNEDVNTLVGKVQKTSLL